MAKSEKPDLSPYTNMMGHPIDIDDGTVLGAGETVEIDTRGPLAKAHIEAGHLLKPQTKEAK